MTRFVGMYSEDWRDVSAATRATTGHRCARCRHPFDPASGAPLFCDAECDMSRGRTISTHHITARVGHETTPLRDIVEGRVHNTFTPGLNFGVHHLDGDKGNNLWWNLLPLCNSCHLTMQAKVIPSNPYLWEHSEWFKPYVAGFYAHWYGYAYVAPSRAVIDKHLDFFLSLGQPWLYAGQKIDDPYKMSGARSS